MSDYPDKPSEEMVRLRNRLFNLFTEGRYDEAADLALLMTEEAQRFTPLEALADKLSRRRLDDVRDLYAAALQAAEWEASGASSGAEGMGRMVAVRRLREKLAEFSPAARRRRR
jgi:hypothetical protein